MPIPIRDARIELYRGHDEHYEDEYDPDVVIPGGDIQQIEINARTDEVMDEAKISLHNPSGRYTADYPIETADRIEFVAPVGEGVPYGNGYYGGGIYGGAHTVRWTGRVVDTNHTQDSYDLATLDISAHDFPADVLANRKITNSYVDRDVGSIIRDICRRKAPEVDPSDIPDFDIETDVKYSTADCWDAVLALAARADAVVIPDGRSLQVNDLYELPQAFDLGPNDYYLPLKTTADDNMKNVIRVDSGENRKVEEEQPVVDEGNTVRVDEGVRITKRLRARKAAIHSIELYVQRAAEDEELRVRLQSDDDGAPVALDDEDSDIASTSWDAENLPADAWKTFFLPEHTLADRDPWLIVETDGEVGHDIGRNDSGELAFRSFYPHPLNFEVSSTESIRQYGAREKRIERDNLKTLTATRDAALAALARRAWPTKTVEFEVASPRGHYLAPGDRTVIDEPRQGVEGEHVITEVQTKWSADSVVLETNITAEWMKGVLAPQ